VSAARAPRRWSAPPMANRKTLERITDGGRRDNAGTTAASGSMVEGYRTLVEHIPGIVYTAEAGEAGQWLYASPQIETILGYTSEDWCSDATLWFRCLHPADRERALQDEQRSRETGAPLNSEYRMIARDGSVIWFHDQATILKPANGGEPQLHGVMLDITDRKLAEAKVRDSEARLAEAQRFAQMGSWDYDLVAHRMTMSDELHRICGLERGFLDGTFESALELVDPADRALVERVYHDVLSEPKPFDIQMRIVRPDGDVRTIDNHGDLVCDDYGQPVRLVGTVQDVTERKRAEGALRQTNRSDTCLRTVSSAACSRSTRAR
jgi:PAS domain S-box-containing protein